MRLDTVKGKTIAPVDDIDVLQRQVDLLQNAFPYHYRKIAQPADFQLGKHGIRQKGLQHLIE